MTPMFESAHSQMPGEKDEIHLQHPSLAELIKQSRRAAGLTQEALAARAGLSARVISDLERNVNHVPRAATLQLLFEALSLSDSERHLFETAAHGYTTSSPATGRSELAEAPLLVGRAVEQALLERHISGEGPPLLMLVGEPGVGKTRLLQEASTEASARGFYVLHGSVSGLGHDGLHDPVLDALRRTIDRRSPVQLRRDLQGCAWLVRLLPELALGPIQPLASSALPPEQESELVVRAVTRFLANIAGPAGTLLTLDGLQNADSAALALLSKLARSATDQPLRIVAACRDTAGPRRDHGLSALLASLAHDQFVRHVVLRPLSTDAAAKLLLACINDPKGVEPELLDRVVQATGGVPFYLTAWAWDLNSRAPESRLRDDAVPWSIRHSVRDRIDASAAVGAVLEAIAAAGGRATFPVLLALAGSHEDDVLAALDSAIQDRLIQEDGEAYVFAYDVVRRVVESDLSHARRLLLRRRLGAVLPRHTRAMPRKRIATAPLKATEDAAERAYHLAVLRRHQQPPHG